MDAAANLAAEGLGGAQRHFQLGATLMNLGAAVYYNAVRPTNGTVWDLRFLVEFNF